MSLYPLYISGSIVTLSTTTDILNPSLFPVSNSVSNLYITTLPDPVIYFTSSRTESIALPLPDSKIAYIKSFDNFTNLQLYNFFYLLGTRTSVATAGPTIDYGGTISAVNISIASTVTALTRGMGGTESGINRAIAAGLAVANTTYPTSVQGIHYFSNIQLSTNTVERSISFASENTSTITINSGSIYLDRYVGYSKNTSPTTASYYPVTLSGSYIRNIPTSSAVTQSILFNTSSVWLSQSLATDVSNTSATVYANVFTLTGLTNGKRYLANLYLISRTAAAATGFRMRVITGSNYLGTLFTPTSTTAYAIQNSADANNITSITAGTWPTLNTNFLTYGEYSFIKTSAGDPQVQILSETAGTAVTAGSGSVIFYREIE